MMNYNMGESRALIAALGEIFGGDKFDEYSILTKTKLPVDFLDSRKQTRRQCIAHWLRWAADRNIGVVRDPDNPTWFRVLPGYRAVAGNAEPIKSLIAKRKRNRIRPTYLL